MAEREGFDTSGTSLRTILDCDEDDEIPVSYLRKIVDTEIGETAQNPTETCGSSIKVTKKRKQKAVFALNAKTKWE